MTTEDDLPDRAHQPSCNANANALTESVGISPRIEPMTRHHLEASTSQTDDAEIARIAAACDEANMPRERKF